MFVSVAIISFIIADVFNYGFDYKSGILIAFIDAINHCISYRSRSEPIRPQTWLNIVLVNVILKRTCGLTACLIRGQTPSLERNFWQIMTVIASLAVVYAWPKDFFYKKLKDPKCKFWVSLGCGLYRARKLLYSLNLIVKLDQESLYLNPMVVGMMTAVLLCDGGSMARNVDYWLLEARVKRKVNVGKTFHRLLPYLLKRTLPTCALYMACAHLRVLDTSGYAQNTVRILNLLHSMYCQNVHGQFRDGLRLWSISRPIESSKEDNDDNPISSTREPPVNASNGSSDEDNGQDKRRKSRHSDSGEDSNTSGSTCPSKEKSDTDGDKKRRASGTALQGLLPNENMKKAHEVFPALSSTCPPDLDDSNLEPKTNPSKDDADDIHVRRTAVLDDQDDEDEAYDADDDSDDLSDGAREEEIIGHLNVEAMTSKAVEGRNEAIRMHDSPSFNSTLSTACSGNEESMTPREIRNRNVASRATPVVDF